MKTYCSSDTLRILQRPHGDGRAVFDVRKDAAGITEMLIISSVRMSYLEVREGRSGKLQGTASPILSATSRSSAVD